MENRMRKHAHRTQRHANITQIAINVQRALAAIKKCNAQYAVYWLVYCFFISTNLIEPNVDAPAKESLNSLVCGA
jgi:hypothetical protein